jgi:alpha-N-arabinofuranosidase
MRTSGFGGWPIPALLFGLAAISAISNVAAADASELRDPSFDSDPPTSGWTVHVYGAEPRISGDSTVLHDGRQSLRISSKEPTDAALGQNIELAPGAVFRLSGWIKTDGLRGEDGVQVGGTFQIQGHDGSVRVRGKSHFGTNDWREESLVFRVPGDGKVRIAVFFVGFGKGTGTAWFDGLRLERIPEAGSGTIRVTRERLVDAPISPLQCGQFVEFLCDLVPGMHAERIDDDSFEGVPPYRVKYLGEADRRERPWRASGDESRGEWTLDKSEAFNGAVSQRIRTRKDEPCTLGVSQDGIYFEKGQTLTLRAWLRGNPVEAAARLTAKGRVLTEGSLGIVSREWSRHELRLAPRSAEKNATLTIEMRGQGAMWIDRVSLLPDDAASGGWRPDVVKALKELRPAVVRLGGSALEDYEWTSGVGDVDRRVPFTTCWGGLEPNRVGIDELVTLCRLVDAEPLICVRWTGKTPADAANEVEYANGPATSAFGSRRAANGHPEPYGVKLWQVGNEVAGAKYEDSLAAFASAMKKADPSIRVLSSFPSERILENAAPLIDYVCPHHYAVSDLEATEDDVSRLEELIARRGGGRDIRLAVTEWNTTAGDWGPGRAALLTLENALKCSRYHQLMQRHADRIEIAIRSNLANSFCSGIIQTRGADLYLAPTYHAQRLYARAGGDHPLRIETPLPPALEELDVSATLSADARTLRIFAVNDSTRDHARTIDLGSFPSAGKKARLFTLADREQKLDRSAANTFEDRDRIQTTESDVDLPGPEPRLAFPPLSVSLIEVPVRP